MNTDEAIQYIKTGIGSPIISSIEIEDKEIKTLFLDKSLLEYFKRYPLLVHKQFQQGQILKPGMLPGGDKCLGILNVNFVPASEFVDPSVDDPFGLSRRLIDLNIDHALPGVLAQRQTITALRRPSYSVVKDDTTGNIKLSSLYDGFFDLTFGIKGDIEQVPQVKLYDVLDLSVAFFQIYIGTTRSLIKFPGPVQFDGAALKTEGENKKKEILARFIMIPLTLSWR